MSTPVVSGIAALIRSNYPELTAVQVKQIIETAVSIPDSSLPNFKPGSQREPIAFGNLSKTGGIVNAFQSISLADQTKPIKKEISKPLNKTTKSIK